MHHFPPLSSADGQAPGPGTASTEPPSRRRGVIAGLTAGVLIGGLFAGTQFASASTPTPADEPAPAPTSREGVSVIKIADTGIGADGDADIWVDDPAWEAWSRCLDEQLGFDPDSDAVEVDLADEQFQVADDACIDLLPAEATIEMEAWDAFDTCLSEQLGDLGGPGGMFGDGVFSGSVMIDAPNGDDVSFSSYDFGRGDGSIEVVKVGSDVSVGVTGDVITFDDEAFEAEMEAIDEAWDDADAACGELLPTGVTNLEVAELAE